MVPAGRAALHAIERAVRHELQRLVDDQPQGPSEVIVRPAPLVGVAAADQLRVGEGLRLVALQPGDRGRRRVPAGRDRREQVVQVAARREHAFVDRACGVGMTA